ncbi:unnamed protein product, partial [Laminaria digitata]
EEKEEEQLWQTRGRGADTPFRPSREAARQQAAAATAAGEQRQVLATRQGRGGGMFRGWGSLRGGFPSAPAQGTPAHVFATSPGERLIQIPASRGGVPPARAAAPQAQLQAQG